MKPCVYLEAEYIDISSGTIIRNNIELKVINNNDLIGKELMIRTYSQQDQNITYFRKGKLIYHDMTSTLIEYNSFIRQHYSPLIGDKFYYVSNDKEIEAQINDEKIFEKLLEKEIFRIKEFAKHFGMEDKIKSPKEFLEFADLYNSYIVNNFNSEEYKSNSIKIEYLWENLKRIQTLKTEYLKTTKYFKYIDSKNDVMSSLSAGYQYAEQHFLGENNCEYLIIESNSIISPSFIAGICKCLRDKSSIKYLTFSNNPTNVDNMKESLFLN